MRSKQVLFVFIDWFDPAYKAGGPIRSVTNFVQSLQGYYDIYVFTGDRDLGDTAAMTGIKTGEWVKYDKEAHVYYAPPDRLSWKSILHELKSLQPDFIYCNSLFSTYFTIYPLLMKRMKLVKAPLVLAPKGMLRPSALRFKRLKKQAFLTLFRLMGLPGIIRFHATDAEEEACIKAQFSKAEVFPILDSPAVLPETIQRIEKKKGVLQLLFVGRVHPIKQPDFLLRLLAKVNGQVSLTIVGMMEDAGYWGKCQELISALPATVKVNFTGEVEHHRLAEIIDRHHIFVLPTKGENFGHAIYEALGAGRPVLISDQTPWRNLTANKAGWDISLNKPDEFAAVLNKAVEWNQDEYDEWMNGARQYVTDYFKQSRLVAAYKKLFS